MSRSMRKTPIRGISSSDSERTDKQAWHRLFRRTNRRILKTTGLQDDLKTRNELSSTWDMAKDGKSWFNPQRWRKWLRK